MPENWQRAGFGIYIHWPFCAAKCPYCDFNSHVSASVDQLEWQHAFLGELDRYAEELSDRVVSSVFFGGGTPSLMKPSVVDAVLGRIQSHWSLANDVEITLEANPTSVEAKKFRHFRDAGVNRVSVGVQALNDPDLRALGRLHSVSEALSAVETARSTFPRTSFDLIYARQNQSLKSWVNELNQALSYDPDHLSLYQLTIEDGTAFGDRFQRGLLKGLPDEDLGADMYEATQEICDHKSMAAYETSNHAKPGGESRHNMIYWRGGDYLGIGPGAHGRISNGGQCYATETELLPQAWLKQALSSGKTAGQSLLSPLEIAQERIMMGLRLSEGLELTNGINFALSTHKINELRNSGHLTLEEGVLRTTAKGRPLLNHILREILAA